MRRMMTWVVVTVLVFLAVPLQAQEASITEETKPLAGYDNGFFVRTADDNFKMKIGTRFQPRYRYENIKGVKDISTFELRRARLIFAATLYKKFQFYSYINHGTRNITAGANTPSWWADVKYTAIPEFAVDVGTIGLPLDFQGEASSGALGLIEPPITATQTDGVKAKTIARQSVGLPTTLGIRLSGDIKRFHYIVGGGNALVDDQHFDPTSRAPALAAKFAFDIFGNPGSAEMDLAYSESPKLQVSVGTGYEGKEATDANINKVTLKSSWVGSSGFSFKWRGLSLINEWYWRKLKVKTGNFTLDDVGYYAHAGYFVIPKKLEFAVRAAQIFREGPDNNAYEMTGGINWYIHGNNVKWQTDFSRLLDYDATEGEGNRAFNRIRTMLTLNI